MKSVHSNHARIFKAFCDERRLEILELLRGGEMCACHLEERLPISQSTLSHHMKILCDSGVVECRKEGKWSHYSISEFGSHEAMKLICEVTAVSIVDEKLSTCR